MLKKMQVLIADFMFGLIFMRLSAGACAEIINLSKSGYKKAKAPRFTGRPLVSVAIQENRLLFPAGVLC
jgi:hypothetical protein